MQMFFLLVRALDADFAIYVAWKCNGILHNGAGKGLVPSCPLALFVLTELAEAGSGINYKCPDNMRWASRST